MKISEKSYRRPDSTFPQSRKRSQTNSTKHSTVFSNTKHGGFFTGCVEHGHQNLNYDWNHQIINGQSLSQTMKIWYDLTVYGIEPSGNLKTKVIDSDHLNNPTCRT